MDCKKADFQLDDSVTFLNCAYMSPLLKVVEQAGIEGIQKKRNPFQIPPIKFFSETDELRTEFARLINVDNPNRIVVIPSASYGLATVARNLPVSAGDKIIVAGEQFPSNVYPWKALERDKKIQVETISAPEEQKHRGKIWNERILNAIDSKTKLVAISNVHWADGTLFDLASIRKRTHEVGAWLAVDGTQSVGALPFDVREIQPDALVVAGYKWLMGPYSIGLAYYGPVFDSGTPIEENWINRAGSEDFSGLVQYNEHYQPGALKYEVGEHSNFILVPMLRAAVKQLNTWGVENIQQYCRDITRNPIGQLREAGFWVEDEACRASHLFGIRPGKHHSIKKIKQSLASKQILVSFRGDSIRVSPNVYNDEAELFKLAGTLI